MGETAPLTIQRIAVFPLTGAVLGFAGSFAWKTRPLTSTMVRGAGKRIGSVRDQHWLTKNPVNYG